MSTAKVIIRAGYGGETQTLDCVELPADGSTLICQIADILKERFGLFGLTGEVMTGGNFTIGSSQRTKEGKAIPSRYDPIKAGETYTVFAPGGINVQESEAGEAAAAAAAKESV